LIGRKAKIVVEKIITMELAIQYTWTGATSIVSKTPPIKHAFSDMTNVIELICNVCRSGLKEQLPTKKIMDAIKEAIRRAPQTKMRRDKRSNPMLKEDSMVFICE
jgi:hypothetical protein